MSALPAYLPSKPSTSTRFSRPQERVACFSILAEDQRETDYIASCLRQIWGVQTVMTSEKAWDRLSA